jgi:hypothetical protein
MDAFLGVAVHADAVDPDSSNLPSAAFAARLKQMGVVQPNPTFSPSSTASATPHLPLSHGIPSPQFPSATNNQTLGVLDARRRLQERADDELANMGKSSDQGREFLDIHTIRDILARRQRGDSPESIEKRLNLRAGVVKRLGPPSLVSPLASPPPPAAS